MYTQNDSAMTHNNNNNNYRASHLPRLPLQTNKPTIKQSTNHSTASSAAAIPPTSKITQTSVIKRYYRLYK